MNNKKSLELSLIEIAENKDQTCVLKFRKQGGSYGIIRVRRSALLSPNNIQKRITDQGGDIIPDLSTILADLLNDSEAPMVQYTTQGGWHDEQLVTPFFVIPYIEPDRDLVNLPHRFDKAHPLKKKTFTKGSHAEIQKAWASYIHESGWLSFALLAAMTPPLAQLVGKTGGYVFNFCGGTKYVRTLILRLAMSVYTSSSEQSLISLDDKNWINLKNRRALGGACVSFITPENSSRAIAKTRKLIKTLGQNNASDHSDGHQSPFSIQLTETDVPLGLTIKSDPQSRLDHLPIHDIDIGKDQYLSQIEGNSLNGANRLLQQVEDVITANYGVFLGKWAAYLSDQNVIELKKDTEALQFYFYSKIKKKWTEREKQRREFDNKRIEICSLIYATGELALEAKIINLPKNHLLKTLTLLCLPLEGAEQELICDPEYSIRVDNFLIAVQKLPRAKKGKPVNERANIEGFICKQDGEHYFFVSPSIVKKHFKNVHEFRKILIPILAKHSIIAKNGESWTTQATQSGISARKRYYKLNETKFRAWLSSEEWKNI